LGLALIAVSAALYGCRESAAGPTTVLSATELSGRWVTSRNDLSPGGWHQSALTFSVDGRFVFENRMYGLYEGQRAGDLAAFTRTEGAYRIDRDRLVFEPQRLVWWDRFDGARSPEHVEEPYPWGGLFDDARFAVQDDHLSMTYTVYPAERGVAAVGEYTRDR
jgi:hypothetical protein